MLLQAALTEGGYSRDGAVHMWCKEIETVVVACTARLKLEEVSRAFSPSRLLVVTFSNRQALGSVLVAGRLLTLSCPKTVDVWNQ